MANPVDHEKSVVIKSHGLIMMGQTLLIFLLVSGFPLVIEFFKNNVLFGIFLANLMFLGFLYHKITQFYPNISFKFGEKQPKVIFNKEKENVIRSTFNIGDENGLCMYPRARGSKYVLMDDIQRMSTKNRVIDMIDNFSFEDEIKKINELSFIEGMNLYKAMEEMAKKQMKIRPIYINGKSDKLPLEQFSKDIIGVKISDPFSTINPNTKKTMITNKAVIECIVDIGGCDLYNRIVE